MAKTILVLLPGMDGTGTLFTSLIEHLPDTMVKLVIPLPATGPQDYESLVVHIGKKLPSNPFYLLAESFSGPLAAMITSEYPNLVKGVLFAASFITPIQHPALFLKKIMPIHLLLRLPGSSIALRYFFAGKHTDKTQLLAIKNAILSTTTLTLKRRLHTVQNFNPNNIGSKSPALYLGATLDQLVNVDHADLIKDHFPKLITHWIEAPHFILQAEPKRCARLIKNFIEAHS